MEEFIGVGRRKTSVSSVRIRPNGSGKVLVNGKPIEQYFEVPSHRETILAPLALLELASSFDIVVRAKGGGKQGQTIATRLGIARALVEQDETRKTPLKEKGYLTRDPRKRERKKYGLAGARKKFQFSKR